MHFALKTEKILRKYFKHKKEECQIEIKNNHFENLDIQKYYDLIFLDIDLNSQVTGIDLAKQIRQHQMAGNIIFVSCRQHLVFDTLIMQPLYFVRKTQYLKDMEILLGLLDDVLKDNVSISFNVHGRIQKIKSDDIYYIEIINHDAVVYLRNSNFQISSTMEQILEKVNATHIIQIHRSYAVNTKYIDAINKNQIFLTNQVELPIGRTFKQTFLEKYQQLL